MLVAISTLHLLEIFLARVFGSFQRVSSLRVRTTSTEQLAR